MSPSRGTGGHKNARGFPWGRKIERKVERKSPLRVQGRKREADIITKPTEITSIRAEHNIPRYLW